MKVNNQRDSSLPAASHHEKNELTVYAVLVALGTIISRGLGFVRDMVIAHYFSRTATDAYVVAFRLPNLFRRLFGEGALTVSFIPVLSDFFKSGDREGAKNLISSVFTMLFIILALLTAAGILLAGPTVDILTKGEGFSSVPGKIDLTIHQSQIMFGYIMLVSLYAFAMGILNTVRVFWLPAFAPALWNLTMIVGVLFFRHSFPIASDVLAWSTMVGGVVQLSILVPSVWKKGLMPRFRQWWNDPAVRRVLKAMGPSILGLSVMQLAVLINTHFASELEEGANSWIFWADRILELPLSLFAVSVGTAALPTLSALWSKGDRKAMSETSLHALRLSLFLAVPCAAGFFTMSIPIVRTLFQHGHFGSHDTLMTGSVVRVYGLGVIFATGVRVLAPAFYAMKNTWLPALSAVIALTCHVFMASHLIVHYGVVGLAFSSVMSGGINFLVLMIAYQKMIAPLRFGDVMGPFLKFSLFSVLMAGVACIYFPFSHLLADRVVFRILNLSVSVMLAIIVYFGLSWIARVPECTETLAGFQRRLSKFWAKKKEPRIGR